MLVLLWVHYSYSAGFASSAPYLFLYPQLALWARRMPPASLAMSQKSHGQSTSLLAFPICCVGYFAGSFVFCRLRIRAQRAAHLHLAIRLFYGNQFVRRDAFFHPLLYGGIDVLL